MYDTKLSDEQVAGLIVSMAAGDRAALDRLYKGTSSRVFSALMRILRDRSDAEDALQNVYVKAWRGAPKFRRERSGLAWLLTIARNEAVDLLRARRRRGEGVELVDEPADPVALTETRYIVRQKILECLRKLSKAQADAILCVYQLGYTYREMADRAGVPENTIRTRLHRGLRLLRQCLDRDDEDAADETGAQGDEG